MARRTFLLPGRLGPPSGAEVGLILSFSLQISPISGPLSMYRLRSRRAPLRKLSLQQLSETLHSLADELFVMCKAR